jgi:hypothetical protein
MEGKNQMKVLIMIVPTETQLRAKTPEELMTTRDNAVKLGGEIGNATVALIDSLNLPLSSGGMSKDHPFYSEMQRIVWSADGKVAAIHAVERRQPAMAGIDPLLQKLMGDRYSPENQMTVKAGEIVGELMGFLGYKNAKKAAALPSDCVAKTAATWRPN